MKRTLFLLVFCMMVIGLVPAQAQFTQDPDDLGAADTVDLEFSLIPCESTNQLQVQVDLYVFNDSNNIVSFSTGFYWDNPNLQMDSAEATQLVIDAYDIGPFFFEDNDINITNANQHFLLGGARIFKPGVVAGPARRLWASYYFTLSDWDINDSILIDTVTFSGGSEWLFVAEEGGDYMPYWTGTKVQHDCDYVSPSNLVVDPDSLFFTGIEGGANPPAQSFLVDSDNNPLDFDIVESISWAIPTPTLGTTPQNINVQINTLTLPVGTYVDSVSVQSADASNSPQFVKLVLVIEPPPPTIGVDPDEFFFNAIAGDTNPAPKTLTITNTGSGTLNWTVSKSEAWLSLTPTSGVDSGDVSVAVDITSLSFGTYYDTIVVSDSNATNSPVRVPVVLTVASDLPVIDVDSAYNFIIVPSGVPSVPPRNILIKNVAGGTMNFTLSESSPRIFSVNPSSGTAPESVLVTFKIIGGVPGEDYIDTLWVNSNEAVNSPFPVIFHFHYVEDPGMLYVNTDTLPFNVFECDMGAGVDMPSASVLASNIGGDNPLMVKLLYESDLFSINVDSGLAPFFFTITASDLQLPQGTYYDTILVTAQKAINSPETLIVRYNMVAGITPPEIFLYKNSYTIPAQENAGPTFPSVFEVLNKFGGCMPWSLDEDVPWLYPLPDSGDVPGAVDLYANATGYVFGEYVDSFFVVAPSATNSPRKVSLLFRVWRFHGDLDYNATINIADVVYMVDFLFRSGPEPEPERIVADMDCNFIVNVADLTYFVDYMFRHGPIPCGNPYK